MGGIRSRTAVKLRLIVPGRIDQATGGYRYAARMLAAWRAMGLDAGHRELDGQFPEVDARARAAAAACLAARKADETLLIDGLALPAFEGLLPIRNAVALVHHPLGLETGLSPERAGALLASEARMLASFAGIVATSLATLGDLRAMGLAGRRLAAVDPGTEPARPSYRRRGTPTILTVATLTPRKDHRTLLRALARIRDRHWRAVFVGSADRDQACAACVRADIRGLRLGHRVRLAGEREPADLADTYRRASIFALASRHEGYGMAFAEALAHGLPVAGARAGAVPLVVPRRAGILVQPGNPAALARALIRLLGPAHRRYAANAWRLQFPDWPRQAARLWSAVAGFAA